MKREAEGEKIERKMIRRKPFWCPIDESADECVIEFAAA